MPESTNIRAEDMLRDNTAFTVYALSASPFEIARKRIVNGLSAHYMQSRLANHAGRLRFCPACAAEQKKIYGEPYWQILFQLDEVEYCPIHRIRVRNTPISYESIRNHFYPASFILDSESATSSDTLTPWDKLFSTNREFFIKLARNVAWILQNGVQYEGCNNLYSSYSRIIGTTNFNPNFYLINKEAIQIALKPLLHGAMLYEYVEAKNPSKWNCNIIIVDHWKACSHILLMTALCDHPKLFYTGI